ncbi:putative fusion of transposase for IS2606 and sialic acid-transport integral membrane protein NanT [Mycobacterium ulcerans str. Harvey]|uniref:Fusion of transposase for IS2606 and sialic acid-transport integral membrane protein NanT n=1 Tax=Mycobacterium ulcerans str. Harvey TaxID=1299332 RepID=A0ABP3ADB2_MYCUL|nr:putative fusion of transposase for IS2606 and sialic acid-transport integral membrane protein NanT [Mycobacterium ulcerans str. Harvey]
MRWCCPVCPRVDHREISAHFAHIYDAAVSKDTVSRITDRVSRR